MEFSFSTTAGPAVIAGLIWYFGGLIGQATVLAAVIYLLAMMIGMNFTLTAQMGKMILDELRKAK
jgi:hypothetical protein